MGLYYVAALVKKTTLICKINCILAIKMIMIIMMMVMMI